MSTLNPEEKFDGQKLDRGSDQEQGRVPKEGSRGGNVHRSVRKQSDSRGLDGEHEDQARGQPGENAGEAPKEKVGFKKRDWRTAINKRLHAEGRYDEYLALRQKLLDEGYDSNWCPRFAWMQMKPLNGDPLEFDSTAAWAKYIAEQAKRNGDIPGVEPEPTPPSIPKPGPDPREIKKNQAQPNPERRAFEELTAQVPIDKKCSPIEAALWAFNMGDTPLAEIVPDDVPGRSALRMLRHARASDGNYAGMLTTFISKTIPDKKLMEQAALYADDGRRQMEMLNSFDREFEEAEKIAELDSDVA
jgi:hypothetical protein